MMKTINTFIDKHFKLLILLSIIGMTMLFCGYTFVSGLQGDDSYYVMEGITSISDLITKTLDYTIAYYQRWNGRFIVNFINVLIVNCGMVIQTVLVVVIISLVLITFYRCVRPQSSILVYIPVILFILLMGSDDFLFNSSCLNIVCNYLFPIPFYLIMVKAIVNDDHHYSLSSLIGLCLLALVSGSLIETYSFALAIFVIVMVITKRFHLNGQKLLVGICYCVLEVIPGNRY